MPARARAQRKSAFVIFLAVGSEQETSRECNAKCVSLSAPLFPPAAENFLRGTFHLASERFALVRRICKKPFYDFLTTVRFYSRGS